MSRDNYHNVFGGYMEELYAVHDQFWSWTLWPCLEQVPIYTSLTSTHPLVFESKISMLACNNTGFIEFNSKKVFVLK